MDLQGRHGEIGPLTQIRLCGEQRASEQDAVLAEGAKKQQMASQGYDMRTKNCHALHSYPMKRSVWLKGAKPSVGQRVTLRGTSKLFWLILCLQDGVGKHVARQKCSPGDKLAIRVPCDKPHVEWRSGFPEGWLPRRAQPSRSAWQASPTSN